MKQAKRKSDISRQLTESFFKSTKPIFKNHCVYSLFINTTLDLKSCYSFCRLIDYSMNYSIEDYVALSV